MSEQERRISRPQRSPNSSGSGGNAHTLDAMREELEGILDAAQRNLDSVNTGTGEAQGKDQVPPGTFHQVGGLGSVA